MRHITLTRFGATLLVLCALAIPACTTQQARLQEADLLAKAGKAFSESVPTLYESFFETTVEVDSIQLSRQRDDAIEIVESKEGEAREAAEQHQRKALDQQLTKTNESLKRQLTAVRAAKRHAEALRAYFVGLEAFTSDDTGAKTGEALKGLVGRVVSFSGVLETAAADLPVNLDSVAEVAGEYIVLGVKSAKLSAHLKDHGAEVNEALALQAAFLDAVRRNMQHDLARKALVEIKNSLYAEYTKLKGPLSNDWGSRRKELLEHEVGVAALDDAQRAAQTLLQSWKQLAEGRLSTFTLETLMADVQAAIAVIQRIRTGQESEQ